MDETEFKNFLIRSGRSESAIKRCLTMVAEYQEFLLDSKKDTSLATATTQDLEDFVDHIESQPKTSAKTHLWAICYYYEFIENEDMRQFAGELREERIQRKAFLLRDFRGIQSQDTEKLAAIGIKDVKQMLNAGITPAMRLTLSEESGVPLKTILELVKLSDLARISGTKGIRARLYHDAGVDTIEKMATWEPEALRAKMVEFVEKTKFDGIAPLPKEAASAVRKARSLPKIVEYE